MLTLQRYSFQVEYRKGSSLLIADTLSRAPLPETTHKGVHDEFVYRVEFEGNNPELSGFQDATVQEIRTEANTDPKQNALRTLIETGWPNDKAAVDRSVMNLPRTKDSYLNKIVLSYLLRFDQASSTSCMQLIVVLSLLFDMLVAVCSGRASTAKSQTCAQTAPLVHSMPSNILENH